MVTSVTMFIAKDFFFDDSDFTDSDRKTAWQYMYEINQQKTRGCIESSSSLMGFTMLRSDLFLN